VFGYSYDPSVKDTLMPLSQDDRIAFSSQVIGAAAQIKGLQGAQTQLQVQINKLQKLDDANKNLFDPVNALVTAYQQEMSDLDGNGRTSILEQDVQDAANKVLRNHFFPNDVNTVVPSLAAMSNIWPKTSPFALGFGIGKSYSEAYTVVTKEPDLVSAVVTVIASTSPYTDFELTTGTSTNGTCSLPSYTDEASCLAAMPTPGVWTSNSVAIHTILTNMVAAVNTLKTFVVAEAAIIVTTDTSAPNQSQNAAAVNNLNNVFIPALNTWLALPDFEGSGAGPSKMHSTQMNALHTALTNRSTFITTRIAQLNTTLGTVAQDVSTGDITSATGYYGKRYNYLSLRLNILGGSLSQLSSAKAATGAQTSIIANINSTASTYKSFLPTSGLKASGNNTNIIHVIDSSLFSVGDSVYVVADGQDELQRAVKAKSGDAITLNDIIPSKYSSNIRIYKDLS
jgi:hypothetical protein